MMVEDERTKKVLIKCRDSEFPESGDFVGNLPKCFPNYQSNVILFDNFRKIYLWLANKPSAKKKSNA